MAESSNHNNDSDMSEKEFQNHLKKDSRVSLISSYLKEIIYGSSDGIVTTFAVVAGFAGATGGNDLSLSVPMIAVLIFGLANLFADGTSMALSNFLSIRADQDVYKSQKDKEREEIHNNPEHERIETIHILKKKGFTETQAKRVADIYQENEECWLEFMMNHEMNMANVEKEKPLTASLVTFFSFLAFGFVPLIPYFTFQGSEHLFPLSIGFTTFALFLLGLLRYNIAPINIVRSVGEIMLLGSVAATVAYFVGSLFRI